MSRRETGSGIFGVNPFLIIGGLLVLFCVGTVLVFNGVLSGRAVPTPTPAEASQPPTEVRGQPPLTAAYVGQGNWYTVFFSNPFYPEKLEDRSGGIDAALVADLDAATKSIDAAVFDIDLPSIINALVRAKQRGVPVRVIADNDANSESEDFAAAIKGLQAAGVPLKLDERSAFMHNKFVIIDGTTVWTGSWNWTSNDTYRNDNNVLRFAIPQLTENYKQRFEYIFGDRSKNLRDVPNPVVTLPNGVRIENYFSPNGGVQKAVENRLQNAKKSIRVMAFSFTADGQTNILVDKAKVGVKVQAVTESRNNDATGASFPVLKRAKVDVLPDGNCYILHNKIYIIDDQTVITGSYNFTSAAERSNDENLLIIDDPTLAQFYNQEFDRVYARAQNPQCGK